MILLDTQLVLWSLSADRRLPRVVRDELADRRRDVAFSAASIWEIAIKAGLGRADFEADPRELRRGMIARGWSEIAVSGAHASAVVDLPPIHRDPFDRLLVAQSRVENVPLWTTDKALADYGSPVRLV